jgi:hypothetical protein
MNKQQRSIENSLVETLVDFAKACNVAAERRDVASWERVGYLAECCEQALSRVTEKQEWEALATWAYHQAEIIRAGDVHE